MTDENLIRHREAMVELMGEYPEGSPGHVRAVLMHDLCDLLLTLPRWLRTVVWITAQRQHGSLRQPPKSC